MSTARPGDDWRRPLLNHTRHAPCSLWSAATRDPTPQPSHRASQGHGLIVSSFRERAGNTLLLRTLQNETLRNGITGAAWAICESAAASTAAADASSKAVVNWSSSLATRFPGSRPDHAAVGGTRPARRRSTATSITRHRYLRAGRLVVRRSRNGRGNDASHTTPASMPESTFAVSLKVLHLPSSPYAATASASTNTPTVYWSRGGVPKSGLVVPATASGAARPPSTVFGVRIRPRAQVAWSKMRRDASRTGGQDGSRGSGRHRP